MKKKGDTKELNSEGRRGLNHVRFSLLLLIFCLNISLFAQVEIGGFVVSSKIKIPQNFNSFLQTDYNNDKLTDLLIYGKNSKEYILLEGSRKKTFKKPSERFYFYPVTDIKRFRYRKRVGNVKLFISREDRIAGFAAFTKYGTLQLLTQKKLDSYPDEIITGDFDKDGTNEALIYGLNFNGLEHISEKKLSIENRKIIKNKIYKRVIPFDLDYDGYEDLIALDILENDIAIFINDKSGNFSQQRSLTFPFEIKDISLADPNDDSFYDILVYTQNSIEAFKGDSVYSFGNTYTILKNINAKHLKIDDFNRDGKTDLLLFNEESKKLELYYRKKDASGYEIYSVINDPEISKIEKLEGTGKYLVHSSAGWIYVLEKIANNEYRRFYPGLDFYQINFSGSAHNNYVAVYDSNSFQARMYKLGSDFVPQKLYESNLNFRFNRLNYLNFENKEMFVLWREGEKVIEVFTIEDGASIRSDYVYSRLPLSDIHLYNNDFNSGIHIMLYGGKDGNILSENITLKSKGIEELPLNLVDKNIIGMVPGVGENQALHAWKNDDSLLYTIYKPGNIDTWSTRKLFDPEKPPPALKGFYKLPVTGTLSLFEYNSGLKAYVFENNKFREMEIGNHKLLKNKHNFRDFSSADVFLVACDDGKKICTIKKEAGKLNVVEIKGIELQNINDYFISSIQGKWYIVFIDQEYFINIERLNEN